MGINIAKLVAKSLKKYGKPLGVKPMTLTKTTPGTRAPGSVSGGTNPTSVNYACSGFIELLTVNDMPATLIKESDRKISILGASVASGKIPGANDTVTIVDLDGVTKTFTLISAVQGDGVGALYSFQARR